MLSPIDVGALSLTTWPLTKLFVMKVAPILQRVVSCDLKCQSSRVLKIIWWGNENIRLGITDRFGQQLCVVGGS